MVGSGKTAELGCSKSTIDKSEALERITILKKCEEDTNKFKKELKDAVIDCFKNIKVEISK